jgi:hypothetical protein
MAMSDKPTISQVVEAAPRVADIIDAALDHAQTHGYRPAYADIDMMQTAISAEAAAMGIELSKEDFRIAVFGYRFRLEELD